jgi:putative transposase
VNRQKQNFKQVKHYNTSGHAHELTFSCYHHQDYLSDPTACEIFLSELQQSRLEHNFHIWAYVLMHSHVHLLIWPLNSNYDIAKILNDTKGRMAKRYRDNILENRPKEFDKFLIFDQGKGRNIFRFWQPGGGFDRNLWNAIAMKQSIEYIEANPIRKKLVVEPEKYRWSSAYARLNGVGVIADRFNMPVAMLNPQKQRIGLM